MKLFLLKLLTTVILLDFSCLKQIIVRPPPVEHVQGQTAGEVVAESMFGMNFGQTEIDKWGRYVEETYGESGTMGRQGSSFQHASIADSLHHTESLYDKEFKLLKLLKSISRTINTLISGSKMFYVKLQSHIAKTSTRIQRGGIIIKNEEK